MTFAKPILAIYKLFLDKLQGQFVGSQFLIKNLNEEKESTFLKVSGSEFHVVGPTYP